MTTTYNHSRPLQREFYDRVRSRLQDLPEQRLRAELPHDTGRCFELRAGEVAEIRLREGAQIVNLFALNLHDPDERLWTHETSVNEGAFIRRYTRLWGTMARYRPLFCVLDETVVPRWDLGELPGQHHFLFGGSGTPADWAAAGGAEGVASTWERMTDALTRQGLAPSLFTENACLFQKTAVDLASQRLVMQPSDACAGDRVVLFVEIDVVLVLALSPYADGALPPSELDGSVRGVDVTVYPSIAEPLPWPYADVPYPDLSRYLGPDGTRA